MATEVLDAVYENGVFRPLAPPSQPITEGQKVRLTIEERPLSPQEMIDLAASVYEGLSEEDINEIERIALDRRDFRVTS